MSDSDLSDAPPAFTPPDSELEAALQKQVREALRAGNADSITVSLIRKTAESVLGLDAGFYKQHEIWNKESKRIVHEAFELYKADSSTPKKAAAPPSKPAKPSKPATSKKRGSSAQDDESGAQKKRRKAQPVVSSEETLSSPPSQLSEEESLEPTPKKTAAKTSKSASSSKNSRKPPEHVLEGEDSDDEVEQPAEKVADKSDSELSVLIDEAAPAKRKKRKPSEASGQGRRKSVSKAKAEADNDPDQAEIKRLQGWLVKCGIRKLWGKELKPYESSKSKIKHLKDMLSDAGMTGRYSVEKASQIKEHRELQADIEAVTEGAQRWGKNEGDKGAGDDDDDNDGQTRPKRRLVRGAQILDFLSSDGEETD